MPLPVPMQARKDMNFSYAGLKNAFRMAVTRLREALGLAEGDDLDHATKVRGRRGRSAHLSVCRARVHATGAARVGMER